MTSPYSAFPASAVPASNIPDLDALLGGTKWGGPVGTGVALTVSFPWADSATAVFAGRNGGAYSSKNPQTAGETAAFDAAQQQAATQVLQRWADVADLRFAHVADTSTDVGDIRMAFTSALFDPAQGSQTAWGWASYPNASVPNGGDIWVATQHAGYTSPKWEPGSGNFMNLLHEVGHALGLKHTFEGTAAITGDLDNDLYSVMSYTSAPNSVYFDGRSYVAISPDTPMLLDIAAAQHLYGANMSHRAGDDVYTFDAGTPFLRTLWDAGGSDTISLANFTAGSTIDLRAGHFSDIKVKSKLTSAGTAAPGATYDGTRNLAIAHGVTIENAVGGAGADLLIGNEAANVLRGGGGNDVIQGGAGIDTAVYHGNRSLFVVSAGAQALVHDRLGGQGRDTLTDVERLEFSDVSLALDLAGNAGTVAKILGAVFGRESVANAAFAGIGLDLVDGGMGREQLAQLAIGTRLGAAASHDAVVDLLYGNIAGFAPDAAVRSHFVHLLDTRAFTVASLGVMAAETSENQANVNLVGLALTGLPYVA